uniref:Uncharacterized protein n=1 Tax=viral metagenome TaxID=1070528 RepID=A0A6C0KW24_9ZZZZ
MPTQKITALLQDYKEELSKKSVTELKDLVNKNKEAKEYAAHTTSRAKGVYINALIYAKCIKDKLGRFNSCI